MGKKNVCAKPANENPKKVVFFQPPKDEVLRNVWVKNIPNNGKELKISSYVCGEHFLDHDINKYSETVINGSIHRVEWTKWKLTLRFRCYAKKKLIGVIEQKRTESHANMKKKK